MFESSTEIISKKRTMSDLESTQVEKRKGHCEDNPNKRYKVSDNETKNQLWVDKYKPKATSDLCGNKTAIESCLLWLKSWCDILNQLLLYFIIDY
jgi:oligoribonuclease (3'-5' exoribonuclease)